MNGYRYLTGKYYEYYLEFSSDDVNDSATNFKSEVELLSEEFENVKNIIVNWSGEGAIAMSDSAINNILTKFEVTKKNIDTTLLPATEAVTKLVEELNLMKEKEDSLIQKEQELEAEKAKSISKTVYDGTDSQGQPIYKDNPKYNSWVKRKNELQGEITALITELDAIKATCDTYIDTISQLESSIEEFTNYLGITSTVLGINGENVDFASMNLEERLSYLDSLLANYNEVMAQLNEFYEKTYGEGFTFSSTDFAKLDVLFDCFNIYDKADVSKKDLVSSYGGNNTVIFNIEALTKLMSYCTENDVFGKIERYANGQSWEESGIASLYEDEWFEYDEKDFLKKMKNDYGIKDVKTYLKNNFFNMKNSYANLTSSYQEYKDLVISMQTMEAKITQLNKAKELLPFEYEMENPAFLNYLNKNYTTYGLLDEEKLQYMSQQEVALYDYLYHNKSPQEAAKYLKVMEDAINQRIGAYKAAEYVEWICQDGFQVTDLAASGYEGFKDGVRNWWDGICDLGRVSSTEAGTKSALDYELMYKSMFMLDAAEGYSANMPEDMRELINQVYQTGSSVGNMAVPMLAGFIPVVGKPLSSALMGLSIAGNSAVEAKQSGATTAQAYLYGVASGVSEATTERLLGGIPGVSNLGKSFLGNMASEGLEEFTQTYMDAGLRNIILGENNDLGSKDLFLEAWESGKQGAITSGVLQMGNAGVSTTLNTTTSLLTGGKITNYGVFKNTVEQNYYTPRAESAINTSLETLASGNKLSMGESIKLSRAINNVSAQELSSITGNLTTEQQSGLQDALKSNLGPLANNSVEKINTASNFVEANNSTNLREISNLGSKLQEEFTRDGRTLGEYLVDTKPESITPDVVSQIRNEGSSIVEKMNNRSFANDLETRLESNAKIQQSAQVNHSNTEALVQNSESRINNHSSTTTQPFQNSEYREELSSGYIEQSTINPRQESYAALETNTVQPNSNQIVQAPSVNMTSQVEVVSTTTTPTIVQENATAELFTPIQQQAKSIATTSNQNTISQTSPRINTSQVVTAGAGITALGLGGFTIGNNISTSTDVSENGTTREISQTRKVQSTPQTEQISRGQVTPIRDDISQTVETRFSSSLSDAEVMELASYQSPTQSNRNTSYAAKETTTFDKIKGFAKNNTTKKNFISSLFKTNRPNITKEQREVVKEINAMIKNGQRCNYSVATSAEISTAMLSEISNLSMVTITIDGGFRDINGNFKTKYSDQRYKARTTFTGLEAKAIISKMEDLQSRIDMSLPEIERARQIYEMIAKEYKYMTDFSRYKDGHMIAAGLRGMTSQNATGKAGLVCAGYAQLYKELCNRAGITCEYIRGQGVLNGTSEPHAWNVLLIDGKEIPVDVTWKSSSGREHFGKSEQFAKEHIADADEIYRNYRPEIIGISEVINSLDTKYGKGSGIKRLLDYIATENANLITRENGLRSMIQGIGKSGVQEALIKELIPESSRRQLDSVMSTMNAKFGTSETRIRITEYLKTGQPELITRTNGARDTITRLPISDIKTYMQVMQPTTSNAASVNNGYVAELAGNSSPQTTLKDMVITTREKIANLFRNNTAKETFVSSLFSSNNKARTNVSEQVVNDINARIRRGETNIVHAVQTTNEISTEMLRGISDLSKVSFRIDSGFRDVNGNFKGKYNEARYIARTTYNGYETLAIVNKIEQLQARIDMSLPKIERARQIYEMIAKEYKYMTDFGKYKDGHMIAAGLRGITSQNATGKAGLVCAGYAQLYKELCNRAGITCEYIRGEGILDGTSEPHAWNVLLIDGKEIPVDVTWKAGGRREWFGKSEEFARSHKADADEIYINYEPEVKNLTYVIESLDAKYGAGGGINRLIRYISTENINEITRENGLREMIGGLGKAEVQNSLIRHVIPTSSRVQIENAVNTILQKYSPQESSLILQEYLKTGRTDIITSTNGARGVFTTIPSTQISTYIQIMHPEIYVQTNSSNSVQPSQSVVINNNQMNSNVKQITYTPNEIQVIKDVEYAIEQMQAKYGYSRAEILERVNKLVQTNNWLQITSQGNAREILQQYTPQELKAAHDTLVSMENVPQNIEEYVKYATNKYMERYNATIEEAIKQVQEVINNQDFMYMTSFGNARDVLMRCSFGEMQQALNKISLQSKVNETVNSIDIGEVNRTTSEFFEQTGNPTQGNYGVDQGALYRMFEFVDHNGRALSYREAKDIVNEYKKTNRPLPKFKKVGTDEYFDLKDEIMKKYGFTNAEASLLFTCIDDAGACSYASVCNEIFNYFKGNPTLFEKTFGFSMYKTINNEQVLNSEKLLIDLYIFANSKENRGRFIFKDASGHYHIDASQLTSTVDPLGRRLLDSEEQVYMSSSTGKNVYLINKYLKTKGLGYNSNRVVKYRSNTNSQNMNSVINHVIEGMKSGKGYSLGIYAHGRPINMIAPRGSNYGSTSTYTWNEGGGHSVFITDVSTEGFIVSSWGEKYTIPFQDLLKNNHWILTEGQISKATTKINPLEVFKKLKGETTTVNRTQGETKLTENATTTGIDNTTKAKTEVKTNPVSELMKLKKNTTSPIASKIESTTNNAQRANSTQSQIVEPLSTSINQNKTGATLSKKNAKVNPVSELIKIKKGQTQVTETTTSTTSELTTPAYVEELSSGVAIENDTNSIEKNKQPITIDLSKEAMQKQYIRIYTNIIDRMLKGENGQSLMNSLPLEDKINIIMFSQMAVELDEDYLIQEFDKLAKKYGEETYLKAAEQLVINPSTFISRNEIEQILSEFAETHPIVEILKNTGLYYESYESFDGAKIIEMLKSGLVKPENLTETVLNKKCNIGEEDMTILEYIITKPSSYENNYRFLLEQAKTNPSLAKKFVDFGKIKDLIDVINMIVSEAGQEKSLFEYAIQHNKIANRLITEVVIESVTFDCDINLTTLNGNSVDVNIKKGKLDLDTEISVNGEKQRMIDFMIQYDIFPNTISSISDMLDKITDSQRKQQVCNCIAEHTNILPEINNIGGKAEDIIETRRIIISKLYNLNDTRLITDFYNFIARNPEYITIENFDIVEVKIVNLLNKIYYSNSDELRRVGENIIDVLIRSSENIVETFEKVEEIFVKNNLPFVGKIFKVFEVLHPNFSGFDFSEGSRVSPILKQKSANNHNSLYRKIVTFSDLIKASFGSNNRNIKNYLSNIEISTKIYESVINGIRSVESLTFQETKELEKFRDHLITMYNNTLLKTIKEQDFIPSDNVISDIHKLKILISPDGTDNYNLANRVVSMFTEFSDIRTLEDAKRYIYSKVDAAHSRNVAAAKKFSLEKGDLVKGIGDVKYLRNILQNGSVSREYLGVAADSDATPLDTDVSMVQKESGTINEKIEPLLASSYGPIYFILKNDDRFITTRTIDGMSKESYSMTEALSKMELFHSGWVDDHYGIRTGFASSEINYIMMKNYDNRVGVEIATNGFYIPVVDFEGNLLFSIEDYDSLRTKMAGLSYYGTTEFTLSNNLINETTTKIRETLADNNEEVKLKRGEIIEAVSKVLKTFGLEVHDNLEGNLTYGTVEFIDTGSTGRGTNKPGDGDFDFIMKLDNNILSNQENMSKLRKLLLERFEEFGEIDKKEFTGDGDFRLKGVQITPEIKVDIDITFTQKTDKVDYSTDMAVRDRLRNIKEQNPEMYDYVIANILQAKKVLTEANVYKAAKSDPKQGGFGGVGVENWILQNGGSFVDAARSFLKVTVDESGNSRTFEGFVEAYPIWDFGDNHLAKGRYPHDNFVTNMSASGYEKMKEVLREFLKAYDATNN